MGKMERQKGARAELEVAAIACQYGFNAERNARNGITAEDIHHDIPGLHLEVKRQETMAIWKWWTQAQSDALAASPVGEPPLVPTVVFRRNRSDWLVCLRFTDLLELVREAQR